MSRRTRLARLACGVAMAACLMAPSSAAAHASLEGTSPERGAELKRAPDRVVFHFSESVEAAFGAVRVYDGRGRRVDTGGTTHPAGRSDSVTSSLRHGLGDGTYTATYRVISADSHPVSGGFVFTVGKGGTPARSLDQLLDAGGAGPITEAGFGIVRGLSYLALALAAGGIFFVVRVWRPAVQAVAGSDEGWAAAGTAFAGRARGLVLFAAGLGVALSALGIVFQGAVAGGTSLWPAFDPGVVSDVLSTRFGTVWGLRLLAWLAVAGLVALPVARRQATILRPARLGATGLAPVAPAPPVVAVGVAGLLGFLCLTPALAGHASTRSPTWLLVPANFTHVVSMALWVGGVAMLVTVLPAATRALEAPADRTRLLSATVSRFSGVALVAVAVLVAGGTVQAIAELDSFGDLPGTAFGRAILIKIGLLLGLIGLGAWNRRRSVPRLERLAASGEAPGNTGVELRRALRAEGALMVIVLGVTAALVSYAPATGATGPASAHADLGPARVEMTVDPARAGLNQVHLYMFDRRSGRQWDRAKQLTVTASLPDHQIGSIALDAQKAGPGHYVIRRAALSPPGSWRLRVDARVSAFDEYSAQLKVPIR